MTFDQIIQTVQLFEQLKSEYFLTIEAESCERRRGEPLGRLWAFSPRNLVLLDAISSLRGQFLSKINVH